MRQSDKIARDGEVVYLKSLISKMAGRLKIQSVQDAILRQQAIAAAATRSAK